MPVEIRELIIKTEISTADGNYASGMKEEDLYLLKKVLLEECKKMIIERTKKNSHKR